MYWFIINIRCAYNNIVVFFFFFLTHFEIVYIDVLFVGGVGTVPRHSVTVLVVCYRVVIGHCEIVMD
jgi:hypothetical protein